MICEELDIFGALPDNIGYIISPIVKFVVLFINIIIIYSMWKNYKQKSAKNPDRDYQINKNLIVMSVFFALAALLSSFDILLGWRNVFNTTNAYLGISIALVFTGIAGSIYYWFLLEVFYAETLSNEERKRQVNIFLILQLGSSICSLILRTLGIRLYVAFNIIQALLLMYLFTLIIRKSKALSERVSEEEYSERFRHIVNSSIFGLVTIVMFSIDAFSDFVTIYSLIGWLCLIGTSYSLYKAYV
ncbi:MAG: hypothetical protein GF364_19865 [Candidatus Lokiarchaeota archaeon]|nr:hypothetical protein [Candidatus Lokiarchaeota archaeon]